MSITAASVFAQARPQWALDFAPHDAQANASAAEKLLVDSAGKNLSAAEALARRALRRDATVTRAWRVLGIVEAARGNDKEAARFFTASEKLSRRDVAAQLWLIEERVRRDDIPGALHHYDIALRTSRSSGELLLPILATGSADPAIAGHLTRLLATDPPWSREFFIALARNFRSAPGTAAFIEQLPQDVRMTYADTLQSIIGLMATRRDYRSAYRVYRALTPAVEPAGALVRNAGFERPNAFPVFEWVYAEGYKLRAEPDNQPGQADNSVLRVRASGGETNFAARQQLLLDPGSYRAGAVIGMESGTPPDRVALRLACVESGAVLLDAPVTPRTPGRRRVTHDFRVPTGCPTQWFQFDVRAPDSPGEVEFWIDDVRIEPAARGKI